MRTYFAGLSRPSQFLVIASATLALGAAACSSDSKGTPGTPDASSGGAGTGGATGGTGGTTASSGGKDGGSTGGTAGTGGAATGGTKGDAEAGCEDLTVPVVPDTIKVPATTTLVHQYHAVGKQTYKCLATDGVAVDGGPDGGVTYAWGGPAKASTPTATLSDGCGAAIVEHSAGPKWTSIADGSFVIGTKTGAEPKAGTIAWLRLTGVATDEPDGAVGLLSNVTFIQRLNTEGGAAPATGCDAAHVDTTVDVNYTADYYFYTGS